MNLFGAGFFKKGGRFEIFFYETKPVIFFSMAVLLLISTSWGIASLALPLLLLYYAAGIVFLRHRCRGSFREWLRTYHASH